MEILSDDRITLREYARIIGRDKSVVIRKAEKGDFKTARREQIGGYVIWTIDREEPYIDNRRKEPRE